MEATKKTEAAYDLRILRYIAATVGTVMSIVAILADRLGVSYAGNFGIGRIVLLSAGLVVLIAALLVKRRHIRGLRSWPIWRPYQRLAVLILNCLIFLVVLELGAMVLQNRGTLSQTAGAVDARARLPYYSSQEWSATYWREHNVAFQRARYEPFVIWRTPPFKGEMINIDQNGVRDTVGADCRPGAYKVFAFGGSTMLGYGAPDWGTIPSYLQKGLSEARGEPVCTVNFGDRGYVSTQSVMMLVRQLQSGNIPNLVVFYDGFNDALVAYETGQAGSHGDEPAVRMKLEQPLVGLLAESNLFSFAVPKLAKFLRPAGARNHTDDALVSDVAHAYLGNYRIVQALAAQYGFRSVFFLQPVPTLGDKPLTVEEMKQVSEIDYLYPGLADFIGRVYWIIDSEGAIYKSLSNLQRVFDREKSQVWTDSSHVTPVGNQLIATEMLHELH